MNKKNHIKEYLDYYKTLDNPGYAVLITGDWGSGKTYQVKSALTEDEMCYVSLFGLTSPDEIYSSVFLKMFPTKAKSKEIFNRFNDVKIGGFGINIAIGGMIKELMNATIKEEINSKKVIVLDDLERSNIKIDNILGVVNKYVEHHGCKVITIVHDERIESEFNNKKEKIFGCELKATPNIDEVFEHLIQEHNSIYGINDIKLYILNTFKASDCNSLRILRHTINDGIRLIKCLDKKHIDNNVAMKELFHLFTALTIQHRAHKLLASDLSNREEDLVFSRMFSEEVSGEESTIVSLENNYKKHGMMINFFNSLLDNTNLVDCIINGYYDPLSIKNSLNAHHYFKEPETLKPWVKLMHFDDLDDEIINVTIREMDEQIAKNELTDIGEILHVFHLKFLICSVGDKNFDATYQYCIEYIDRLFYLNKIPIPEPNQWPEETISGHAHGFRFWIDKEYISYVNNIKEHIKERIEKAIKNKYPEYIKEIKNALSQDIDLFKKIITITNEETGKYSHIDILAEIPPTEFINTWLKNPKKYWLSIRYALEMRYKLGDLEQTLHNEVKWIKDIQIELEQRASHEIGFEKLRIQRLIPKIQFPNTRA